MVDDRHFHQLALDNKESEESADVRRGARHQSGVEAKHRFQFDTEENDREEDPEPVHRSNRRRNDSNKQQKERDWFSSGPSSSRRAVQQRRNQDEKIFAMDYEDYDQSAEDIPNLDYGENVDDEDSSDEREFVRWNMLDQLEMSM